MNPDAVALAEELNRRCHCVAVDHDKLARLLESGPASAGVYDTILRDQPNLFSSSPVFVARAHLDAMRSVVAAIERVIHEPAFQHWALALAPEIARVDHGTRGVFLGYDFHLGRSGPQLIEINTNAGGALLNAVLLRAQQACCIEVETQLKEACVTDIEMRFVEMFRREWQLQRGSTALESLAIVDDEPEKQYLYPEFRLFRDLFERFGLRVHILDPRALVHRAGHLEGGGERIDLVYNRLTDFHLQGDGVGALRDAYVAGDVVVTPNPRTYALYADKRHLTVLSDEQRLREWRVDEDDITLLLASIPRTVLVDPSERDRWWSERKRYFFKPIAGYGGKAAYRGDKLTRSVWEQMASRLYVAQCLVPPSERTIRINDREVPLKLDLRNYVYDGEVQLVAARLYQGQTTNFRTAGGGFAGVLTEREA
jgi:hypothetical protein